MRTLWAMPVGWVAIAGGLAYDAFAYDNLFLRFLGLLVALGALGVAGFIVLSAADQSSNVVPNHEADEWSSGTPIPGDLDRWNWGAVVFAPWWALGHRIWWGLLALIPYVGLAVAVYLGYRGNRFAWNAGPWQSVHQFTAVQKKWTDWAAMYFFCLFVLFLFIPLLAAIAV